MKRKTYFYKYSHWLCHKFFIEKICNWSLIIWSPFLEQNVNRWNSPKISLDGPFSPKNLDVQTNWIGFPEKAIPSQRVTPHKDSWDLPEEILKNHKGNCHSLVHLQWHRILLKNLGRNSTGVVQRPLQKSGLLVYRKGGSGI